MSRSPIFHSVLTRRTVAMTGWEHYVDRESIANDNDANGSRSKRGREDGEDDPVNSRWRPDLHAKFLAIRDRALTKHTEYLKSLRASGGSSGISGPRQGPFVRRGPQRRRRTT